MSEGGFIVQLVIYSLMAGVTYFLIASGLSLVFGVLQIVNFAHGQFYMLGAFALYFLFQRFGMNFFLAVFLSTILTGILGVIVERLLFRPVRDDMFRATLVGLGLVLLIPALAVLAWGAQDKGVDPAFAGSMKLLGASIGYQRLVVFIVGLAIMAALFIALKYTKIGIAMRAVTQDPGAAAIFGISVDRIHALTMGIGCALAGVAGALMAPLIFIHPSIGEGAIFSAFIVVVIGGLGSIPGALIGGLILGFVNIFGQAYFGPLAQLASFVLVILVILIRPQGILGHET
jgi:branched-chain amino acid transport system permease protein